MLNPKNGYGDWNLSLFTDAIKENVNNRNYLGSYLNIPEDYIQIVTEDEFLSHVNEYIHAAYLRAQDADYYDLSVNSRV